MRMPDDTYHLGEYYTHSDGKNSWSETPTAPYGYDREELERDLHKMLEALKKPAIDWQTGNDL